MKSQPKNVLLVTALDGIGITRLPRILSDAGCRVTLLAPRGLAIQRSLHILQQLAGDRDPQVMASALLEELARERYDLVIAADEPLLWALAKRRTEPWIRPWFPVDPANPTLEVALSKHALAVAALAAGIDVPRFCICGCELEGMQAAANLRYPVILKSAHGLAASGVRFVANPAEFSKNHRELAEKQILVQEFVDGEVGASAILFDRGKPRCWFSTYLRENWPNRYSSASAYEFMDHAALTPLIEAVGKLTGFNGLCGIDWIHDKTTDRVLLLELNPRPTPGLYLGRYAGVDFARAIHDWLTGVETVQCPQPTRRLVRMFPQALYRAIDDRSPFRALGAFADAPWRESALVAAHLRRVATHYLPSSVKRAGQWLRCASP